MIEAPARRAAIKLPVEFPIGKPEMSRIHGMRRNQVGMGILFIGLFPLFATMFVVYGLRTGFRALNLLKSGLLAKGTYVSKRGTSVSINDRPQYELMFDFKASDGNTRTATVKTVDFQKYEKKGEFDILYSPSDSNEAVLLEAISGSPSLDPSGRTVSCAGSNAVLILPVLAAIQTGFFLWLYL